MAPTAEVATAASAVDVAQTLAREFAATAAERDAAGGTPKRERDRIRDSGLLRLIVPVEHGGQGGSWSEALRVVRTVAAADPSLAHVLGYHYLGVATPHLFGTPEQRDRAYAETARGNFWWGNALNPLDPRTTLAPQADGSLLLDGAKSFCSGSHDAQRLVVSGTRGDTSGLVVMVVPTEQPGVRPQDDWDNMGQRQTDSGAVRFEGVRVVAEDVLSEPGPGSDAFATLRTSIVQAILTEVYLGIAQGAFAEAREYTRTQARAWPGSGVERASQDPYVLRQYGELWSDLRAATLLADEAGCLVDAAWREERALTPEQRAEVAVAVAAAKVHAGRVALAVSNRMFEMMGSRATSATYRYDRFWRNARTLTLHDPLEYKLRELGDWALNGEAPRPGLYS